MSRQKSEFAQLHKILTNFRTKLPAACIAACAPLAVRLHTACTSACIAACVVVSNRSESRCFNPGLMPGYRQKIAPQKRSWGFA